MVVIFSLALFTGTFWAFNEYEVYRESITNIRNNYQEQYRSRLAEEMQNIKEFIEFKRSQTDILMENELRQKVQTAYTIASHIHSQFKDEKNGNDLSNMVVEILRPIRWSNERGSYFTGRVKEKSIDLFADDPFFEGKHQVVIAQEIGMDVVGDIINLVEAKGAGIYRYNWLKQESAGKSHRKITFVKYFEPFDWFIGASAYLDDMENLIRVDVLNQVQKIHFGLNGEVFGFRSDGTIICHRDERIIGRSVKDLNSKDGMLFGQRMWDISKNAPHEGYISYSTPQAPSVQRLSYVKMFKDWDMTFVTSMNMEEMELAIANETRTYIRIAFKNAFLFVLLFSVAVACLLLVAYSYSLKIKHNIQLFTDFFRNAADDKLKIENTNLAFAEFEDLALLANRMIDDRIYKEQLLRRDEMRLDTLLRLGLMDKFSFQKKYDFILRRIVQITGSEAGYMALVDDSQSQLSFCSLFPAREKGSLPTHASFPISDSGLAGIPVVRKQALIINNPTQDESAESMFPYPFPPVRHIDVPVYSDGKIVLVAGVCNNSRDYDNSDIQQVIRLLEGLWLHVLKIHSEIEMARLERQVIAVSLEERNAIGRDLHDGLGSHLSGVEMLTKVLEKKLEHESPDKAEQLGRIRGLIRDAIDKTRLLAHGLYPVHIIEQGFEASIEEFIHEIEGLYPLHCSLFYSNTGAPLDNNAATHVYYIIREAVYNAARHGKAGNVAITVEKDQQQLFVRIEDDGQGLPEKKHRKGMGLHIMKYRAKAIKASLSIQQGREKGTVVSLTGEVQE